MTRISARDALSREYSKLLERHGVVNRAHPKVLSPEERESMKVVYRSLVTRGIVQTEFDEWLRQSAAELDGRIQQIASQVEQVLGLSGIEIPNVYAAEFPHGSFNARTCAVAGGALVLLNRGLISFLYDASLVIASRIVFAERDRGGIKFINDQTEVDSDGDSAGKRMSEMIYNYLFSQPGLRRPGFELPDRRRFLIALLITRAAEVFTVAHEYGHIVAGHLNLNPIPRGSEEWLERSWAQEMEADHIGGLLLLKSDQQHDSLSERSKPVSGFGESHGPFQLSTDMVTCGPMFFFALDELITRVGREVEEVPDDYIVSTHPPSETRSSALRDLFEQFGEGRSMPFADSLTFIVRGLEDTVVKGVRSMLR